MDDIEILDRIDKISDKIIKGIAERIENAKLTCKACSIFEVKENVEAFYDTTKGFNTHLIEHKKKKEFWQKIIMTLCSVNFSGMAYLIINHYFSNGK